ncbi:hypothetical protein GCM10009779_70070 [Polymorphospora rubra]|uniref:Leucine rich repeat variant n=1 Tax=Polymorphospora rubra TaxID=338584 RepID=A0A810NC27_9ACTN|nr:hypothetical protein Prubr_64290 [Polymorphospora rubra]
MLRGLARNPAARVDVLLGVLRTAPLPACQGLEARRDLPRPLQDVMVEHPLRDVRSVLAEHPGVDPGIRGRLLLADPDWRVVVRAFGSPDQQPLSDHVLHSLLARIEDVPPEALVTVPELYAELWPAMRYDLRLYRLAAKHPDPRVRRHAAAFPRYLDDSSRGALMADPVPEIREVIVAAIAEEQRVMQPADLPDHHCHGFWAVLQRPLSRALVDRIVASGDEAALYFVGPNPSTPPDVVQALLRHSAAEVRRRLAERIDLSREQLLLLACDSVVEVRTAVSVNPGLTEQQRADIDIDVTTVGGDGHYGPRRRCRHHDHAFVDERVPPLADAMRWASSVNPLLRRRAARNPELPSSLVTSLADDPDLGVRVLLALHHPDAPSGHLLRCFLEYHGCGREQLTELARFPTAGVAVFADHTDPAVRRLAVRDPQADPELVEQLLCDPDITVRQATASCRRLPHARITALLGDPELAEHAAANPALPVEQMRRILESAPVPEA